MSGIYRDENDLKANCNLKLKLVSKFRTMELIKKTFKQLYQVFRFSFWFCGFDHQTLMLYGFEELELKQIVSALNAKQTSFLPTHHKLRGCRMITQRDYLVIIFGCQQDK